MKTDCSLIPYFDDIAAMACECVEFTAGESDTIYFDFELPGDDGKCFIEGSVYCCSDWAEHTGDGWNEPFETTARGCYATLNNVECYGFTIPIEEYKLLLNHVDDALKEHVRRNYPD